MDFQVGQGYLENGRHLSSNVINDTQLMDLNCDDSNRSLSERGKIMLKSMLKSIVIVFFITASSLVHANSDFINCDDLINATDTVDNFIKKHGVSTIAKRALDNYTSKVVNKKPLKDRLESYLISYYTYMIQHSEKQSFDEKALQAFDNTLAMCTGMNETIRQIDDGARR